MFSVSLEFPSVEACLKPFDWRLRAKLFVQRSWQPTSACLTCMPGSLGNVWSLAHWRLALQTGLGTGILALLLSVTRLGRLFKIRYATRCWSAD